MANPEKLLASATRLYGDAMGRLWGEVLPVPPSAMSVLQGGERIVVGTRTLDVEYTPGHASHHVSFFDRESGVAFVGDTGGVRLMAGGFVMPPTPPPDVDLDAWERSLGLIDRWRPETLFLTHFGPSSPVGTHLSALRDHITLAGSLAKRSLARDGEDADREAWFADELRSELTRRMNAADAHAYEVAGRFDLNCRRRALESVARTGLLPRAPWAPPSSEAPGTEAGRTSSRATPDRPQRGSGPSAVTSAVLPPLVRRVRAGTARVETAGSTLPTGTRHMPRIR
jgi:glyoxylase-like metal-dependent hydrolase (beta-lactamase superfamily II)